MGLTAGYASAALLAATAAVATGLKLPRAALAMAPLILGAMAKQAHASRYVEYFSGRLSWRVHLDAGMRRCGCCLNE
ncbi:hypothetical protein ACFFMP_12270 [Pseudoroseomonas cervicalis]